MENYDHSVYFVAFKETFNGKNRTEVMQKQKNLYSQTQLNKSKFVWTNGKLNFYSKLNRTRNISFKRILLVISLTIVVFLLLQKSSSKQYVGEWYDKKTKSMPDKKPANHEGSIFFFFKYFRWKRKFNFESIIMNSTIFKNSARRWMGTGSQSKHFILYITKRAYSYTRAMRSVQRD